MVVKRFSKLRNVFRFKSAPKQRNVKSVFLNAETEYTFRFFFFLNFSKTDCGIRGGER